MKECNNDWKIGACGDPYAAHQQCDAEGCEKKHPYNLDQSQDRRSIFSNQDTSLQQVTDKRDAIKTINNYKDETKHINMVRYKHKINSEEKSQVNSKRVRNLDKPSRDNNFGKQQDLFLEDHSSPRDGQQAKMDAPSGDESESVDSKTTSEATSVKSQHQTKNIGRQPKMRRDDRDVNLSFCGCGFLGIYHVGVASCFHQYAPQLSMHKISGSSAGALVAMAHICGDLQLAYCTTDILAVAIEARSHTLGSLHPSFDIQAQVRESLERGLPEDAYLKANGKLHVSLTRVEDGENVIISEFDSNEDLIQVLLCSCFIPLWSGIRFPKYKNVAYIDGGFTNNLLILDEKTVTVSPFAGEADICPQDDTLNLLQVNLSNTSFSLSASNLYRLSHALLPPEPEILSDLCKQGFADGIRYLQRMNLISCTKCLEIRSSLLVTTDGEDIEEVFSSSIANQDNVSSCEKSNNEPMHIVLRQQEQETIEITDRHQPQDPTNQSESGSRHLNDGNNNVKPPVTLYNLLNGISQDEDSDFEDLDNCNECVLIRERALYDPLPKLFSDRILEASEKVNKSLLKWIYSHRPIKYLSYLMAPYYVPVDLTLAIMYKFWKRLPVIRSEISDYVNHILDFMIVMLRRMQTRSTSAILMGFGTSWEEDVLAYEKELIKQKQEQVHHHHHHHHHHHLHHHTATSNPATASAPLHHHRSRAPSLVSSSQSHAPKELHSLEDTFDSIVDVTSKQEARIFAYYFRDAKNRLQVTEIFDLEQVPPSTG